MIVGFACRETAAVFEGRRSTRFPPSIHRAAMRKLWMLDAAVTLDDIRVPPANRLEKLKGDRAGYYSIRINDQWRICFKWERSIASDVEIVDYH